MSSPEALRAKARTLREAAGSMTQKAAALVSEPTQVRSHYPSGAGGVWVGPAADAFHDQLDTAITNLGTVESDVSAYAGRCRERARQLDHEADDLEAEQKTDAGGG